MTRRILEIIFESVPPGALRIIKRARPMWRSPWFRLTAGAGVHFWYFLVLDDYPRKTKGPDLLGDLATWWLFVAILPFLTWARYQFPTNPNRHRSPSIRGVQILLTISLATGTVLIGMLAIAEIRADMTGIKPSWRALLVLEIARGLGVPIGGGIGAIAYLIQLWQKQWFVVLTLAWFSIYCLLLLSLIVQPMLEGLY